MTGVADFTERQALEVYYVGVVDCACETSSRYKEGKNDTYHQISSGNAQGFTLLHPVESDQYLKICIANISESPCPGLRKMGTVSTCVYSPNMSEGDSFRFSQKNK